MSGSNQGIHTVWHEKQGLWANVREGEEEPLSTHPTKEQAVERGRALAQASKVEHHIHAKTHEILERNSYGNDRRDRPG